MLFIVTPMHNFTVPASLKLWLDHVIRINRSFHSTPQGKVGLMKDIPTFVLVSSGGFHVGERARQLDFLTPYLRYALASIGINATCIFSRCRDWCSVRKQSQRQWKKRVRI
jgi:FMN-dependent NADH-azoreductase